ncbi:MAG: DinB family protein [Roseomonas sp.]|nr:DinB family protein [Roseomonas sp.]
MISVDWCHMMAAYNSEMNRRLYAAADGLDASARQADGGAFWGSIQGTLCHLLWGDTTWMSRFDGWDKPSVGMKQSPVMITDWAALKLRRVAADQRIEAWAAGLSAERLAAPLTWHSAIVARDVSMPLWIAVGHFFNHQTHHRGQAHALLTRAGAATGDTDLPWVLDLAALGLS